MSKNQPTPGALIYQLINKYESRNSRSTLIGYAVALLIFAGIPAGCILYFDWSYGWFILVALVSIFITIITFDEDDESKRNPIERDYDHKVSEEDIKLIGFLLPEDQIMILKEYAFKRKQGVEITLHVLRKFARHMHDEWNRDANQRRKAELTNLLSKGNSQSVDRVTGEDE